MEHIPNIDVFIGNSTCIDFDIYMIWLQEFDVKAIKQILKEKNKNDNVPSSYILNQFRMFGMLEPMLQTPKMLSTQLIYQISSESQVKLLESYYQYDDIVIREILGKKLSKGTRRDLDDVAAKTQKQIRCCQRQFDNCRRVFKTVIDLQGNLVENIKHHFQISLSLSWFYGGIVFLSIHKFNCLKKKLSFLVFNDFAICSKLLIENWTSGDSQLELDQDFFHELRSLKIVISDQKVSDRHKQLTLQEFLTQDPTSQKWADACFRQISKPIIVIAINLYKIKELRDLFVDINEKIVETCIANGWTRKELDMFLEFYYKATSKLQQIEPHKTVWEKYMSVLKPCILKCFYS